MGKLLRNPLIWCALFIVAVTMGLLLDAPVARFMREQGVERWLDERARDESGKKLWTVNRVVSEGLKLPGEYGVVALCAVIAGALHKYRWRAGAFVMLATLVSGMNGLIKWIAGRHRPFRFPPLDETSGDGAFAPFQFMFFRGGLEGLFDGRNLSLPSGHASLAFALAMALTMLFPRWAALFFAAAVLCGLQRIAENAHWVSDVVLAAALGIGGVLVVHKIMARWLACGELAGAKIVAKEK